MVAIIDYDAGNIRSVEKALKFLGQDVCITRDKDVLMSADQVILPGVGSFGDAMGKLHKYGLVPVIREIVNSKIPFFGVCLGLQLLFDSSDEAPETQGLGILKGRIKLIPNVNGQKVPHIGWNSLSFPNKGTLFNGIDENAYVYFVHSYYLEADDASIVTAKTEYGVSIDASVEKGNVFACQFHPEKSSDIGIQILRNFISLSKEDL